MKLDMQLDLETLKYIKSLFELHSDHSTQCGGYRSLCRKIKAIEKMRTKKEENSTDICKCIDYYKKNYTDSDEIRRCETCNKPINK